MLTAAVVLVCAIASTFFRLAQYDGPPLALPGTNDFIEYWGAFQLFRQGHNPYSAELLEPIQRSLGWRESTPLMMWNPPWTLILLGPFLLGGFALGAIAWLCFGVMLVIASGVLVARATSTREQHVGVVALLTLLFFPVWVSLQLGQIGALLLFGSALTMYGLVKDRPQFSGIGLAILTIKPHLFYILGVSLLVWILRWRRFKILGWFASAFAVLTGVTAAVRPDAFTYWLNALGGKTDGTHIRVAEWRTASLVEPMRSLLSSGPDAAAWLIVVFPTLVALIVAWVIVRRDNINWAQTFPLLLLLSAWASPFAWIFDYAILAILQAAVAAFLLRQNVPLKHVLIPVIGLIAIAILSRLTWVQEHHQFFWYPGAVLLVWWIAQTRTPVRCETGDTV